LVRDALRLYSFAQMENKSVRPLALDLISLIRKEINEAQIREMNSPATKQPMKLL